MHLNCEDSLDSQRILDRLHYHRSVLFGSNLTAQNQLAT